MMRRVTEIVVWKGKKLKRKQGVGEELVACRWSAMLKFEAALPMKGSKTRNIDLRAQ